MGFIDLLMKKANSFAEAKTEELNKRLNKVEDISGQILAARDSMIANGFKKYEYIANRDCCEVCAKLNGKHFLVSSLKIGVNAPPMHEGCSCSITPYESRKEYEEWLNSL